MKAWLLKEVRSEYPRFCKIKKFRHAEKVSKWFGEYTAWRRDTRGNDKRFWQLLRAWRCIIRRLEELAK